MLCRRCVCVAVGAEYLRSFWTSIPRSSQISRAVMLATISCAIMYFSFLRYIVFEFLCCFFVAFLAVCLFGGEGFSETRGNINGC